MAELHIAEIDALAPTDAEADRDQHDVAAPEIARREAAHDGPMWSNGSAGEIRLTRVADRWRIAGITVRPAWADGNMGILDPAR